MSSDPSAGAVLDGLFRLARGWSPQAREGPGALVDADLWSTALVRLADRLLASRGGLRSASSDDLSPVQVETLTILQGEEGRLGRLPEPRPWSGHLVVVVGCGRSGTTWLERMLMVSEQAGGIDGAESFVFEQAAPLWRNVGALAPLVDRNQLVAALRCFYDEVFAQSSAGATHFIEKTPLHSFQIPLINAVYPDASFLHLVRDGRDVARSISQVPFFRTPDPADAARLWSRVLETVRAEAPSLARFREVRYEQLLADPEGEVVRLLSWLGIELDEATRAELAVRAVTRVSTHAGTAQAAGRDTWRSLHPRDLSRVYAACGELLVAEGYASRRDLLAARLRPASWRATSRR